MKVFKFRVVLDGKETVFRDVVMDPDSSLEDFHNAILNMFSFSGQQMASFYRSNSNWDKGEEFPLVDMFEQPDQGSLMGETAMESVFEQKGDRILYIYDFLNMKIFLIELLEVTEMDPSESLPQIVMELGTPPPEDAVLDLNEFSLTDDPVDGDDIEGDDWDMDTFEDIDNLDI